MLLSVGWATVMFNLGEWSIYNALGAYALFVTALLLMLDGKHLLDLLRPTRLAVATGLMLGVVMLVATHVVYGWLAGRSPAFAASVRAVYAAAKPSRGDLAKLLVIVAAEELLWRGTFLAGHSRDSLVSPVLVVLSVLAYALTQLASGNPVIALAAVLCGLIWTSQRLMLKSLTAPMLTHAIWTVGVVFVWPLERLG